MSETFTLDDPLREVHLLSTMVSSFLSGTFSVKLQGVVEIHNLLGRASLILGTNTGNRVYWKVQKTTSEELRKVLRSIASEYKTKSDQYLLDKSLSGVHRYLLSCEEGLQPCIVQMVEKLSDGVPYRARLCQYLVTLDASFADVGVDFQCWFLSSVWRIGFGTLGRGSQELGEFEAKFDSLVMPLDSEVREFLAWCKGPKYSVQEFHGCCDVQMEQLIPPLWSLVYTYLAMPSVSEVKREVLIKFD